MYKIGRIGRVWAARAGAPPRVLPRRVASYAQSALVRATARKRKRSRARAPVRSCVRASGVFVPCVLRGCVRARVRVRACVRLRDVRARACVTSARARMRRSFFRSSPSHSLPAEPQRCCTHNLSI